MLDDSYPKVYLYRRIVLGKLFIDEHFDEAIGVECIAERAFFSKFHFIRLFKKVYGKTPHEYLSHVRIEKAKQLLAKNFSVTETCFMVGFQSVGSFAALFKRQVGKSPGAYQVGERRRREETLRLPFKFIPGCFADTTSPAKKSNLRVA